MIGYLCLFALSFFLVKSFYKTCVFIMIWSLVLMNFNVGNDYTVWGLTSYVALLVFLYKILIKEINVYEFPFYKTYALLILSFVLAGFSLKIGSVGSIIAFFLYPLVSWMAKDKINRYWRFLLINLSIFTIIILSDLCCGKRFFITQTIRIPYWLSHILSVLLCLYILLVHWLIYCGRHW